MRSAPAAPFLRKCQGCARIQARAKAAPRTWRSAGGRDSGTGGSGTRKIALPPALGAIGEGIVADEEVVAGARRDEDRRPGDAHIVESPGQDHEQTGAERARAARPPSPQYPTPDARPSDTARSGSKSKSDSRVRAARPRSAPAATGARARRPREDGENAGDEARGQRLREEHRR